MLGLWIGAALACSLDTVQFADVQLSWHLDGDTLHGEVRAPGPGWVAVAFNDHASLEGSRLLMFAIKDGVLRAEEHLAQPPNHPVQRVLSADEASGVLGDKGLVVRFQVPAVTSTLALLSGEEVWLTLAWSVSPDFDHHSRSRRAQWVKL